MIKNVVKHFCVITHHKWVVLKLCIMAGIPIRGIFHDLSKYTPVEFINSVKYFAQGKRSPISVEKETIGYSKAWLHHKGRNKHHSEYWHDDNTTIKDPIMPYKYACEMVCDKLAAGIVYKGKEWTKEYQLEYWKKEILRIQLNEKLKSFVTEVLEQVSKNGINATITKRNLRKIYDECVFTKTPNHFHNKDI